MENDNCAANVILLQMLEKRRTRGSSTDSSSDEEILFQQHFRISRAIFEELLTVIRPEDFESSGRPPYPILDSLLLTIWTLATQESLREIGSRFNVSVGHAHRIIIKICQQMTALKDNYILWPRGHRIGSHLQDFRVLRGQHSFPNVFGCVDGTQIPIPGPTADNSYYNRKEFHPLQLQAICDAKSKFNNVCCGWPGSVHDARVWQNCQVYKKLEENPLDLLPARTYLLGDTAYPLAKYLITPFKDDGHLTRQKRVFNARLSSTRVVIEQAFGRLKGMFRRLKYLNIMKLSNAKYILITACILHNLCIDDNIIEDIEFELADDDKDEFNPCNPGYNVNQEAIQFRNEILSRILE